MFQMDILDSGKFVTDTSFNGRLTPKMTSYIRKMTDGNIIYFKNIKYVSPRGDILTDPIYRLFIIDDKKRPIKWGF